MSILTAIRDRFATQQPSPGASGDEQADAAAGGPPFAGYDRLDGRGVIDGLSGHSQVELETMETYERAHKSREPVLDKLRYMRGREPVPGYDALTPEQIMAVLDDADTDTIKKVRGYERKFANRSAIVEEVARVHHERLAATAAAGPEADK